jgi:hypothetical protein
VKTAFIFLLMKYSTFFIALLLLLNTACTGVTSTNLPGKKTTSFPKKMIGEFEVIYPEDFAALIGDSEDAKTYVTFTKNVMTFKNIDGETSTDLGDSLYVSVIGKTTYLSMGEQPSFTIFKVGYSGKDILLYPMYANQGTTKEQLQPYFADVQEIMPEYVEGEEPGDVSFSVTIDDKKLDSYFKSDIPLKEPYRLKRTGGKK